MSQTVLVVSFGLAVGILVSAAAWKLIKELPIPGRPDAPQEPASMPFQAVMAILLIFGGAAGLAMLSRASGFSTPTAKEWESALLAYGLAQLWYLTALFVRVVDDPKIRALISGARDLLSVMLSLAIVVATIASIVGVVRQGSLSLLGVSAVGACLVAVLVMVNRWHRTSR